MKDVLTIYQIDFIMKHFKLRVERLQWTPSCHHSIIISYQDFAIIDVILLVFTPPPFLISWSILKQILDMLYAFQINLLIG